jgi:hypothetical protein
MKILTLFLIALMIFAASPVFACGDSSGEDKDDQSFTIDVQYLCGTCGCAKKAESKPEKDAGSEDEEEEEADDKEEADDQCGGDKDGDKDEEPEAMCSGSGCGRDKDETEA